MIDEREIVRRAVEAQTPPPDAFQRMVRRRDRKVRNQRIATAAVVAALVVAAILIGTRTMGTNAPPRPAQTPTVELPTGTGQVLSPGEVLRFVGSHDNINYGLLEAVGIRTGRVRVIARCEDPCVSFGSPAASPDGRFVAYDVVTCIAGPCEPQAGIWMKGASGAPHQLTQWCDRTPSSSQPFGRCWGEGFAWSPIGNTIAYSQNGDQPGIFLSDPDGSRRTFLLGTEEVRSAPVWSPDGSKIVYATTHGLYLADPAGGGSRLLFKGSIAVDDPASIREAQSLAWSPDGTRLVFESSVGGRYRIYVVNADGTHLVVAVDQPSPEGPGSPIWSPDGTRLAYITTPRIGANYGWELRVVPAIGGPSTLVHRTGCCIGDWSFAWSPDGTHVAYMTDVEHYLWYSMPADGNGTPQPIKELAALAWQQGR